MSRKYLLSACFLLASWSTAFAQVNVTVNTAATVRTVDERVFGVNSVIWDQAASLEYSPANLTKTIQLVQDAGIRAIRLPGGSNSDEYHWYENKFYNNQAFHSPSGFNSSSTLIRNITPQAQAMVTVNYGTGTPEEAAAWVAYANFSTATPDVNIGTGIEYNSNYHGTGNVDFKTASYWANLRAASPLTTDDGMNFLRLSLTAPMGFKYWEIGNEVYGQTWETDNHSPKNEPYTYATNAAAFIQKMKAVDPTIKIGVVVEMGQDSYSNGTTHSATNLTDNTSHSGWTPVMLATLKQLGVTPDFLIYHRYDQAPGKESDSGLLQTLNLTSWNHNATDLRGQITNYFGAGGDKIELVVTENNSVYSNPGKQSTSLVDGLFMADSVGNILQSEFNGLMWWAFRNGPPGPGSPNASLYGWRNYGDYGMLSMADGNCASNVITCNSTSFEKFPTYYTMKLLSLFARGGDNVITASSDSNLLAVYGTKRSGDGSISLLVINKSSTATTSAQIAVSGFTPSMPVNVYSYGIANDNAANPTIGTGCSGITSSTISTPAATFTTSFAPYSINVLTFDRATPILPSTSPAFVTQPASRTAIVIDPASFNAGASGCPIPTYQWQRMANGATIWQDLTEGGGYNGTTTANLSIASTAISMSGDQFRVIASNSAGTTNSNAATLSVGARVTTPPPSTSSGGGGSFDWALLIALTLLGYGTRTTTKRQFFQ